MALVATTQRFSFRAVHSLHTGSRLEPRHGHQFFVEISYPSAAGAEVESVFKKQLGTRLDGQDLRLLVPVVSGEMLVEWIHEQLIQALSPEKILAVAIQETRKNRFLSARSDARWI